LIFLDLLLGGLLAYGFLRGFMNGFIVELASLFSLVLGIYVAIRFSHVMEVLLQPHVSWDPLTIRITSFVLTVVLVVVGISLLSRFLTGITSAIGLSVFNKLFGGALGVVKMALILSIAISTYSKFTPGKPMFTEDTMKRSLFLSPLITAAPYIYPSLEGWFYKAKAMTP
jgi:membrane protein required for colicin V production